MNGLPMPGGVPELGRPMQVMVTERHILSPASCELRDGGVTINGCDVHIEVLDMVKGAMYLVPLNSAMLSKLANAALVADQRINGNNHTGERKHDQH